MKKIILSVAVVALFASCKKDYTCTCNVSGFDNNGNPVSSTDVYTYTSVSGANANLLKADCEASNAAGTQTTPGCVWEKK